MKSDYFRGQLKALPTGPGVYLFKDEVGKVLYVGKAANLRGRVRSYFGSSPTPSSKLQKLTERVTSFDFLVTDSEQEAILLECNLIKKHRPRYNVRLKDDKSYPYLKISLSEEWPRVYATRRLEEDGSRYFGPFASAGAVRKTLSLLKKLFPFRSCRKSITGTDSRPCLEYHIHRCLGPCIGAVSREEYREVIEQVILFLEGKQELVIRNLRKKMEAASEKLQFEKAGILRDQIEAVERVIEHQKVASPTGGERDAIALARYRDQAYAEIFFVRGGKLLGREHFLLEGTGGEELGEITGGFLKQFYGSAPYIPPQVLVQSEPHEAPIIEKWLSKMRGGKVELRVPRRGGKKKLVEMVAQNAQQGLEQLRLKELTKLDVARAMEELQRQLFLPRLPRRMECYDISDISGTSAVGSMVVFGNGKPKKAHYRRFKIKTVAEIDDYAMMGEVLRRRFGRYEPSKYPQKPCDAIPGAWGIVPDFILIDGGKGHLNAALEAVREAGLISVPLAALAKENEEIFVPQLAEPIRLPRNSPALYLLQQIRDEAHRFALSYHVRVRRKAALKSELDEVPGIGPKRKRALLKKFGSLKAIREASLEKLSEVPSMTHPSAEKVKEYL